MDLTKVRIDYRGLDMDIYIRKGTTDEKVIEEVFKANVYEKKKIGFLLEKGDKWLDLGGNIGTFSMLALAKGADKVVVYEPEPENMEILKLNLEQFPKRKYKCIQKVVTASPVKSVDLYISKGDYNKYRHTIYKIKGRDSIRVLADGIVNALKSSGCDCIKMDIEGAEIDILETIMPEDYERFGIKKLVFEYSFDRDRSIPRFMGIIRKLREYFGIVHYTKVKEDEKTYTYYPPMTIVYCKLD